jgi:hypothetical protein
MPEFRPSAPTQRGIALLAKAQAGRCAIQFTRIATGCGSYAEDEDFTKSEALKDERQSIPIPQIEIVNDRTVYVRAIISNETLEDGYHIAEIGLFAEDPDEGEILYAMTVALPNKADWMPAYNGLLPSEFDIEFYTEVSNAETVTVQAGGGAYALADDVNGLKARTTELENNLEETRQIALSAGTARISAITIPADAWTERAEDNTVDERYKYEAVITVADATSTCFPCVALDLASTQATNDAGLCPTVEALDGTLRFWAQAKPTATITGTVALLSASAVQTGTSTGGTGGATTVVTSVVLAPGGGLTYDSAGRLMLDAATREDLDAEEETPDGSDA